jgi:hypothetical protein
MFWVVMILSQLTALQIKLRLHTEISYAGARLAFGGKELQNHTVPKVYGAIEPTAVFVPLKEILKDQETFKTVTTEVFGPLQVSLCPLDVCGCPLDLPFRYDFVGSFTRTAAHLACLCMFALALLVCP